MLQAAVSSSARSLTLVEMHTELQDIDTVHKTKKEKTLDIVESSPFFIY